MEDSEKRRERLKAMRTEAAQAEGSNNIQASVVPGFLNNPLLDSPATLQMQEESCGTPRFDFYTDPMAAFSANKRRSVAGSQVAQGYFTPPSNNSGSPMVRFSSPHPRARHPEVTPFPAYQMQSHYSPNQRMYQAQGPYNGAAPNRSPRGMPSPFPMHQGTPPEAWSGSGSPASYYNYAPHGGMTSPYPMHQGNSGFGQVGSPTFSSRGSRARWLGNSPVAGRHGGTPTPASGRGRGQWHGSSMSPGFGRSGGRGRGFRSLGCAPDETLGPECFYHKSMVEDPWEQLEPVLWRGLDDPVNNLNTPGSSNSWLPKSIGMKKQRVSEVSNKSSSRQSLAEYLAASFNEAVNDSPSA